MALIVIVGTPHKPLTKQTIKGDLLFQCVAFKDVSPQAPTHFLVIPKKCLERLDDAQSEDEQVGNCKLYFLFEQRHKISNNVVCATSQGSDQPVHTHSLIRALLVA